MKRSEAFDTAIAKWQERHGIDPETLISGVESVIKNLESVKQKPDVGRGQAETPLPILKESTSKAGQLGTKRRKHEEEDAIAVQDDHPLPKKQKLSPLTPQVLKSSPPTPHVLKSSPPIPHVLKSSPPTPQVRIISPTEVPKKEKLSPTDQVSRLSPTQVLPVPSEHVSDASTKSVRKRPTTSPVSDLGRSPQGEAEVMDISGANSNHQGPSEDNQDIARDKKSPRRNVDEYVVRVLIKWPRYSSLLF